MRIFLLGLALAAAVGCASMKKDTSVCPEFRNIRCGGDTICTMDPQRGCRTCRCQAPSINRDPAPDDRSAAPGTLPNIGD